MVLVQWSWDVMVGVHGVRHGAPASKVEEVGTGECMVRVQLSWDGVL